MSTLRTKESAIRRAPSTLGASGSSVHKATTRAPHFLRIGRIAAGLRKVGILVGVALLTYVLVFLDTRAADSIAVEPASSNPGVSAGRYG
jgi:hypothetical protein